METGAANLPVTELALKDLEERIFWSEVGEAFDRLAEDPHESALQKAEIALWEQGTAGD